jgi:tetratricopeptide (TPR) repeat protein
MNPNDQAYQALLKRWQKALSLTDSDTNLLHPLPAQPSAPQRNPQDLAFFRQKLQAALEHEPQEHEILELQTLQRVLHLTDEEVVEMEQQLAKTVLQKPAAPSRNTIFSKTPSASRDEGLQSSTTAHPSTSHPSMDPGIKSGTQSGTQPGTSVESVKLSENKESVLKRRAEIDGIANTATLSQLNHPVSHPLTAESEKSPPRKEGSDAALHLTPAEANAATATAVTAESAQTAVNSPNTIVQTATSTPVSAESATPVSNASAEASPKKRSSSFSLGLFLLLLVALGAIAAAWWFLKYQPTAEAPPTDPQKVQQAQQQAQTSLQEANKKAQEGQLDAAVQDYTQAINADPKNPVAYVNRGLAYQNKGDRRKALEDYTQAIALNDKLAEAYNNRSHVYFDDEKYDQAIADAEKAIDLRPNLPEAYLNLGNAWFAKKDLDKALENYNKAIQFNPIKSHLARVYNGIGSVFMAKIPPDQKELEGTAKTNLDEALKNYDQAVQLDPKYADGIYNRALTFERKRDLTSAIRDFKDAAKLYQEQGNDKLSKRAANRGSQLENSLPSPSPNPSPSPSPQQTVI